MSGYRAEFMVEPFIEGSLGPPVLAAIDAVEEDGFEPQVGAFGTTITGEPDRLGVFVDQNFIKRGLNDLLDRVRNSTTSSDR